MTVTGRGHCLSRGAPDLIGTAVGTLRQAL
jgi:hypothetical protein